MEKAQQVEQEAFSEIQPGKCPIVLGEPQCPPTREVDCVEVLKVFDQCLKEETIFKEFQLREGCVVAPTDRIACEVLFPNTTCDIFNFGTPDQNNLRNIIVRQHVTLRIRVFTAAGVEKTQCAVTEGPFDVFQEIVLFAPEGTFGQCSIVAANCECTVISVDAQVFFCRIQICKEIQVKALVKLLVPTFGFCIPTPCVPAPFVELPCPPENLFPPQRCDIPDVVVLNMAATGVTAAESSGEPKAQVAGVTVTVNRGGTIFTAVTDVNEDAAFPGLTGGFHPGDIFNVGGKVFTLPAFCCRLTVVRVLNVAGAIIQTLVFCDGKLILTLPN